MDSATYQRVIEVCEQVRALPPGLRAPRLDELCGGDAALRGEVESMLAALDVPEPAETGNGAAGGAHTVDLDPSSFGAAGAAGGQARTRSSSSWTGGRAPPAVRKLQPGTILVRRYEVMQHIGRGGMGEVFRARDTRNDEDVALKFLSPTLARNAGAVHRLRDEVRAAREVKDRYCCRVNDFVDPKADDPASEVSPFISMEFISGEDLSSLLRRVNRIPDKALQIAHELGHGLAAIHEKKLVHRDLKPANVMIDGTGTVRILDFGIARPIERLANEPTEAGTPEYMAPELMQGEPPSVRSDLYALGLILYEAVTGQRAATITRSQYVAPASLQAPDSTHATVNPLLERAILRCLEKDPSRRFGSAAEFLRALPPLQVGGTGPAPGWTTIEFGDQVPKLPSRTVLALAASVLVGFITLCVLLIADTGEQSMLDRGQLQARARAIASRVATGFDQGEDAFGYGPMPGELPVLAGKNAVRAARPGRVTFWYRWSPRRLEAGNSLESVSYSDPPANVPGMVLVRLDASDGRLLEAWCLPRAGDPAWSAESLVRAATDPAGYGTVQAAPFVRSSAGPPAAASPTTQPATQTAAERAFVSTVPLATSDNAAWVVRDLLNAQGQPALDASIKGLLFADGDAAVYFGAGDPSPPPAKSGGGASMSDLAAAVRVAWNLVPVLFGVWLAGRSMRLGRKSPRQAMELARIVFLLQFVGWLMMVRPFDFTSPNAFNIWAAGFGQALFNAAAVWVFYVAIDPYARRVWTRSLISYARFAGDWRRAYRDPIVGRSLLTGLAGGVIFALLRRADQVIPRWLGWAEDAARASRGQSRLLAVWGDQFATLGYLAERFSMSVYYTLFQLVMVVLLYWLIQKRRYVIPAYIVLTGLLFWMLMGSTSTWAVSLPIYLCVASLFAFLLVREGVLAVMMTLLFGFTTPRVLEVAFMEGVPTGVPLAAALCTLLVLAMAVAACLSDRRWRFDPIADEMAESQPAT